MIWRWRSGRRDRRECAPTPCADCGVELMPDTPPGVRLWQRYKVYDQLWRAAGVAPLDGWLCIPCLETRLGRPLTGADVPPLPLNDPDVDDDTPRLAELKRAAAEYHVTRST